MYWLSSIVLLLVVGGSAAGVERGYTLSEDAEDEILSIEWFGIGNPTRRFWLYGDGRLVARVRSESAGSPDVKEPVEQWLSREEVREIVDLVVDAGLIEPVDPGKKWTGPPYHTSSTAELRLRVSLASYESPRRKEVSPFEHSVGIHSPTSWIRFYRQAKAAGLIPESEPDIPMTAEAGLQLYKHLAQLVYGDENKR